MKSWIGKGCGTLLAALVLAAGIAGCGGGSNSNGSFQAPNGGGGGGSGGGSGGGTGGGGAPAASAVTVSGVAATGIPMSGSAFLKDSASGGELASPINPQTGAFSFDVTGRTAPFMLRAGTLYSLGGPGTVNINPLTTLLVAEMGGFGNMSTLNGFYANPSGSTLGSMFANRSSAQRHLRDKMAPLFATYGVPNADPISGSFQVGQGLDRMFDDLKTTIDGNGTVTMTYPNGVQVFGGPMGNLQAGTLNSGSILAPGSAGGNGALRISPAVVVLQPGQTVTFTANLAVTWSAATAGGGAIDTTGTFTAPQTPGIYLVRASGITDTTQTATATVMVGNPGMQL